MRIHATETLILQLKPRFKSLDVNYYARQIARHNNYIPRMLSNSSALVTVSNSFISNRQFLENYHA